MSVKTSIRSYFYPFARLKALAMVVLLIFNCLFCPAILASASSDLDYSDLTKLANLETIVYGHSYQNLPSEKRIDSLEKIIFGKMHKGPMHTRIYALVTTVNGKQNNLLAPPIAPELDRSNTGIDNATPPLAPGVVSSHAQEAASPSQAQEDRVKTMLQQAMQLYGRGQTPQAESVFKNVLKLDSQNSDANFNLGAIAEGRSDWQGALHYYEAALTTNPGDDEIKNAIASMQTKIATINKNTNKANKMSPEELSTLREKINQAANDYEKGNYDSAINNLRSVLAQAPDQADVYYALAQAYKAKGMLREANLALNQATKLAPENTQYKNALFELSEQTPNRANDTFASNNPDLAYSSDENPPKQHSSRQDRLANQDISSASGPTGQITPFSDEGNTQLGWQPTSPTGYYSAGSSYYLPSITSGYMPGYAYSNYIPSNMSYRIERAAIYGLAGAAIMGGMFSLMNHGHGRHW